MNKFPSDLYGRLVEARAKHTIPVKSTHQAYALILEELDEFWTEVKLEQHYSNAKERLRHELLDIAAMCWRVSEDLNLE